MEFSPNEFAPLTRLLHLKRFEVPPPGFHRRFRARVMTRIDMEREWAALPWWHRALATLTLKRGLAVANGVALAGIAFLGVATFHIANTILNEEDAVHTYAALPLPGLATTPSDGERLLIADASTTAGAIGTIALPRVIFASSTDTGIEAEISRASEARGAAPAWLFDPPSQKARKPSPPRFILPGTPR